MDNKDFKRIWDILDLDYHSRTSVRIASLHHGGKVKLARRLSDDLDEFCKELAARAKAEYENQKGNYEALQADYGDGFDAIEPSYTHGLDFGPEKKA